MKIRTDFVTNSSSTSFVIITTDSFDKASFFELMGVGKNSPLLPLFNSLYYHLETSMYTVNDYLQRRYQSSGDWLELLRKEFADEVVDRIVEAKKNGYKVFLGELGTEGADQIEAFFCTESFEVENEKIYFNALDCAW